jgi:hypothetical protein
MPDSTDSVKPHPTWTERLRKWLVPAIILLMAAGIVFLISGNWNTWASDRAVTGNRRRLRARGSHATEHEGCGTGGDRGGFRLPAGQIGRSARSVARATIFGRKCSRPKQP